jgi:predicted nucleic acid-binding protein
MSRVFWDTNLFIYLIEDFGEVSERVVQLRERMLARGDQLLTSTLTLGEVLAKPIDKGDEQLARQYEAALVRGAILVNFDQAAGRRYARIRSDRTIRPPDAIQLACAAEARSDLFITNDERLSQKVVDGIQFIVSLDRAFL